MFDEGQMACWLQQLAADRTAEVFFDVFFGLHYILHHEKTSMAMLESKIFIE